MREISGRTSNVHTGRQQTLVAFPVWGLHFDNFYFISFIHSYKKNFRASHLAKLQGNVVVQVKTNIQIPRKIRGTNDVEMKNQH